MTFKVTRLGPPRIRQDTITVGGVVFTAGDLTNPAVTVAIADLTDVDLTGLADGDVLIWDATSSTWLVGSSTDPDGVRDAGRWEVVMVPGITSPPDPVQTVAGDDWVYGWVT